MKNKFQTNSSPTPASLLGNGLSNVNTNEQQHSSTTVLTRSAASRAALAASHGRTSRGSVSGVSHHSLGGKIVKPIALRISATTPSSTTSSISSSTSNHQPITSKLVSASKNALAMLKKGGVSGGSGGGSMVGGVDSQNNDNFSLIAKYFASFPATRLKAHQPTSNSLFEIPLSVRVKDNELCTKFNNMVKLNESSPLCVQPIAPQLTSSPFFNPNSTAFHSIPFKQQSLLHQESQQQRHNSDPYSSGDEVASLCGNGLNENDINARLSQITMETRSTRKFLLKHHHHHPYLMSNVNQQDTSTPQPPPPPPSSVEITKRPSINFIKMKKNLVKTHQLNYDLRQLSRCTPSSPFRPSSNGLYGSQSPMQVLKTPPIITDDLYFTTKTPSRTSSSNTTKNSPSNYLLTNENTSFYHDDDYLLKSIDPPAPLPPPPSSAQPTTVTPLTSTALLPPPVPPILKQQLSTSELDANSSICGSKSSNADADSGYHSETHRNHHHRHHHQCQITPILPPKHNYYTRCSNANTSIANTSVSSSTQCHKCNTNMFLSSSASSTCTCDLDLDLIEND